MFSLNSVDSCLNERINNPLPKINREILTAGQQIQIIINKEYMMKNTKLTTFVLAPIALSLMASSVAAKDVEQGFFVQGDIGQAKSYQKGADLRNEVLPFGDVGFVTPLSQKRRAWKASTGYRFNNYFAMAVSYADLGLIELGSTARSSAISRVEGISGKASALSAIFNMPLTESFNLHAKAGYAHLSARSNHTTAGRGIGAGSNNDVVWGAGMSYDLSENLSLMLDWERYEFDRKTDVLSAGLRYTFGEVASAPKAVPAPAPMVKPEPVVAPEPAPQPEVIEQPAPEPKPAPVPVLEPLNVNLFFANNSSVLSSDALALLAQAKTQLSNDRVDTVLVEGTASASGNVKYNQLLSMRRANAVADYIKANWNVEQDKVTVAASGENNAKAVDAASDRKVSVSVKFN